VTVGDTRAAAFAGGFGFFTLLSANCSGTPAQSSTLRRDSPPSALRSTDPYYLALRPHSISGTSLATNLGQWSITRSESSRTDTRRWMRI
jgi:hypothetical protein